MGWLSQILFFPPFPPLSWAPSAMSQSPLWWDHENPHPRGPHSLLLKSAVAPALFGGGGGSSSGGSGPQQRNPLHGRQLQWSSHAVLQSGGCGGDAVRSHGDSPGHGEEDPRGWWNHAGAPWGVPAPLEPRRVQRPLERGVWKQPGCAVHVLPAVPTQGRGCRPRQGLYGENGSSA